MSDRHIRDVRDLWGSGGGGGMAVNCHTTAAPTALSTATRNEYNRTEDKENPHKIDYDQHNRKKYRTLDRHLSMKKTIRKKMMRDLREIGDASNEQQDTGNSGNMGFLEQIRTDQPPSANVDKPSFWKRLTKGWGHS